MIRIGRPQLLPAMWLLLPLFVLSAIGGEHRIADYLGSSPDTPPVKQLRLSYVIIRVPARKMAEALLQDDGKQRGYWRNRLETWEAASQLEVAAPATPHGYLEGPSGKELTAGGVSSPVRYINQWQAARFWRESTDSKTHGEPPPNPVDSLFQDMVTRESPPMVHAQLRLLPGRQILHADIQLHYEPKADRREITTWPLGFMKLERYLFRPWHLELSSVFRLDDTLFLGSQMEGPRDGQISTGYVLAAFGMVKAGPEAIAMDTESDLSPGVRHQSWTLAVPNADALPWIQQRTSAVNDDKMLREWLSGKQPHAKAELVCTAAVSTTSGNDATLRSGLEWIDGWGYEPMPALTDFRVAPCDLEEFVLGHTLQVSVQQIPIASTDPFTSPNYSAAWGLRTEVSRPAQPARWIKLKSAMERKDDDDLGAIEIAQCPTQGNQDEEIISNSTVLPGQTNLVGAVMRGNLMHLTFQRLVLDQSTADMAPNEEHSAVRSPMATTWIIESPLSWESRLLRITSANELTQIGEDLLKALQDGEARLVGQSITNRRSTVTEHRIFNGENYVNTCTAPTGVFFNTRTVGSQWVGHRIEMEVAGHSRLKLSLQSFGEPDYRHWGLWQPRVVNTTMANSGLRQPIFPKVSLAGTWKLEPGAPKVIAALRVNELGRVEPTSPRLRWYLMRLDAPLEERDSGEDFGVVDPSWQAMVIGAPDSDLPPVTEILDDVLQNKRPLLEHLTVRQCMAVAAISGSDMHYLNGRDDRDDPTAPEKMPKDMKFNSQVSCCTRTLGLRLEYHSDSDLWNLAHDTSFPETVTDTFSNCFLEFPYDANVPYDHPSRQTTVCVERPIFDTVNTEFESTLPEPGGAFVKRLSNRTALLVRRLK